MAYTATVSGPTITVLNGRTFYRWTITEVEASQTSEFAISDAPLIGTIVLYNATRTAGTGVNINPTIGRASGFVSNTQNEIGTNTTTAGHINDASNLRYNGITNGKIFIRNTPSSAVADHSISTEIEIISGVI